MACFLNLKEFTMYLLTYSLKTPLGLRDHFEAHEARADLDKAYAAILTRDRLFTANKCLVLESTDYDPPPVEYREETALAAGGRLALVKGQKHTGWLYHDSGKTYYHFYLHLQDFLSAAQPLKAWQHDASFNSFEEEVIERWLTTGKDVKPKESKDGTINNDN
jgi:hypothetical protein